MPTERKGWQNGDRSKTRDRSKTIILPKQQDIISTTTPRVPVLNPTILRRQTMLWHHRLGMPQAWRLLMSWLLPLEPTTTYTTSYEHMLNPRDQRGFAESFTVQETGFEVYFSERLADMFNISCYSNRRKNNWIVVTSFSMAGT